ncbi:hypothetical protein [Novosphingobium sp. KACC 22771]|uniref:hypothetical protein n=1 Tax=Novosphingobium sp. KACC 22771 TaxID=3025670 RepID=UPI002366376B|nr:hypothetical protein [Novosphingobium sp. KACC 22771]WDF71423.1 hypothetical protein PQ467_11445 [Novosphingobium sp. KACC 22771]
MMARMITAAMAGALMAGPCLAGPAKLPYAVEKTRLVAGSQKLDHENGYIAISANERMFASFLRIPDSATHEAYQAELAKELEKARKRYASALADWNDGVKAAQANKTPIPKKPEEPTESSLSVTPPELRDLAGIGNMFIYSKEDGVFTYLEAVKPGTYVYYGPVMRDPAGLVVGGTCMCMGTVEFDVKPGVITDLGNQLAFKTQADPAIPKLPGQAAMLTEKAMANLKNGEISGVSGLPEGWKAERPAFRAHGKINNYYGLFLGRLGRFPGVLSYRRDVVVDDGTGQELVTPTITSRQKPKLK